MRIAALVAVTTLIATGTVALPAAAQQRAAPAAPAAPADTGMTLTPGPVIRVVFMRVNTGMGPEFQRDMRQHLLPIWDEEKRAGILVDYSVFTNSTTSSPDDWGVGYSLVYSNWAALDSLGARTGPITLRHYGSAEARTAAGMRRDQLRTVVQSMLLRAQIPGR